MNCTCPGNEIVSKQLQIFEAEIVEMADTARRLVKSASDPLSGVIHFLHERPENVSLKGLSVKDSSLAELKRLSAGLWFDKEFRDERVPLLTETLDLLNEKMLVNIELKNYKQLAPGCA